MFWHMRRGSSVLKEVDAVTVVSGYNFPLVI